MIRNAELLVQELVKRPTETAWLEFKESNKDPKMIGEQISALANSAVLHMRDYAYLIWGVSDSDHQIVGTSFDPTSQKIGNEPLVNWIRHSVSDNIDFEFESCEINGKGIVILRVSKAVYKPATFENAAYIRDGSATKRLDKLPALQERLWSELRRTDFEMLLADVDLSAEDVISTLDFIKCFDLLSIRVPTEQEGIIERLIENELVARQEDGLYALTNLGAMLFAKDVSRYPGLSRKSLRIVQYAGKGRTDIIRQIEEAGGYAITFDNSVRMIEALLPAREVIDGAFRKTIREYPTVAIREALANAIIHQDFTLRGMNLSVEIFDDRVEISNPGTVLVDTYRIVNAKPQSRNEKLSDIMRRMHLCEELGTGWDKIVDSCETYLLPAPTIAESGNSTCVTIRGTKPFKDMTSDERLHACYMHACSRYAKGESVTNASLRERFGLDQSNSSAVTVSRIIKRALEAGVLKPNGQTNHYIPGWA